MNDIIEITSMWICLLVIIVITVSSLIAYIKYRIDFIKEQKEETMEWMYSHIPEKMNDTEILSIDDIIEYYKSFIESQENIIDV